MHKDAKSHSSHFHSSIRPVPKTRAASKSGIISCRKDEVWICWGASTYGPMNSRPLPLVETLPIWPGICKPGWSLRFNASFTHDVISTCFSHIPNHTKHIKITQTKDVPVVSSKRTLSCLFFQHIWLGWCPRRSSAMPINPKMQLFHMKT